jgi:hypothetical protein
MPMQKIEGTMGRRFPKAGAVIPGSSAVSLGGSHDVVLGVREG